MEVLKSCPSGSTPPASTSLRSKRRKERRLPRRSRKTKPGLFFYNYGNSFQTAPWQAVSYMNSKVKPSLFPPKSQF